MILKVGTFNINSVEFSDKTRLEGQTLTINKSEMLDMVLQDPNIADATLDIAHPGDPTRIIGYGNVIEPRLKIEGPGVVYPGVCGRSTDMVGSGTTYRMAGVAVIECIDRGSTTESYEGEDRQWGREQELPEGAGDGPRDAIHQRFIDMSGPGAVTPYASTINICLVITPIQGLPAEEQHYISASGAYKIIDRIADVMKEVEPDSVETFDTTPYPDLPTIAYIPHMASTEPVVGAQGTYGTSIYGQVRLSAPWYLSGTELLDGAVVGGGHEAVSGGGSTWIMANNPIVLDLIRRHGKDVNFVGCIIQRTNWTNQSEYRVVADRTAHLATQLKVDGAIITTDIRGQRWVGTMLTLSACEQAGIKAVLLTEEEDNENGAAPPFLFTPPEFRSAVSTGTGDVPGFDAVTTVIGEKKPHQNWYQSLAGLHGRYGIAHVKDYYGLGQQSYADFFSNPAAG